MSGTIILWSTSTMLQA